MPLTPNFSWTQSLGTLTTATITDTSTGTDNSLTGRLIYLRKYTGDYLTPTGYTVDYIYWPIADSSLEIEDLLDKDYCVDVTVYWFTGSTATYNKTILTLFTGYSNRFLRQLTQALEANRDLLNNKNYWYNKIKLRCLVDDAIQAVEELNDQTIGTFCLDEAKKLTDNPQVFY